MGHGVLFLEKIMKFFVRLIFLHSCLIDGETCKRCKVSLVEQRELSGIFSLGHALKSAI